MKLNCQLNFQDTNKSSFILKMLIFDPVFFNTDKIFLFYQALIFPQTLG